MSNGPFDLSGRGALVTGGNRGIGLAMARALASAGASVCIWGRDVTVNAAALEELHAIRPDAAAIACDVSDEAAVEQAFAATVEAIGPVHSCFANAAVPPIPHPITEYPTDEWRRVLGIDLDGVFFTLRAAARHMVAEGAGGSLVATSSTVGSVFGQPQRAPYAVAKGGLESLIRTLAVELGRHLIRANILVPGWVETRAIEGMAEHPQLQQAVLRRLPIRRMSTPDDLAGIAVYLASDASAYHTGDTITVDGGYRAF